MGRERKESMGAGSGRAGASKSMAKSMAQIMPRMPRVVDRGMSSVMKKAEEMAHKPSKFKTQLSHITGKRG